MHTMRVPRNSTDIDRLSLREQAETKSVISATLLSFNTDGGIRVLLPGDQAEVPAVSAIKLSDKDVGSRVMLAFGLHASDLPVITGRCETAPGSTAVRTKVNGDRIVIQADREIELRCGDASILLTRAGKILIRGNFVLSHSRGMQRIRGASVHIN